MSRAAQSRIGAALQDYARHTTQALGELVRQGATMARIAQDLMEGAVLGSLPIDDLQARLDGMQDILDRLAHSVQDSYLRSMPAATRS